jgi:hypothetical protein
MRRINITAFIAFTAVSAFLLVMSFTPLAKGKALEKIPLGPGSVDVKFVGMGGGIFQPGQNVDIRWTLKGDGVKYLETNPWSECELYFSSDAGQTWTRITPQLSVTKRDFQWTVPNVVTRQGVIALQIGIEGDGDFYLFASDPFMVLGRR